MPTTTTDFHSQPVGEFCRQVESCLLPYIEPHLTQPFAATEKWYLTLKADDCETIPSGKDAKTTGNLQNTIAMLNGYVTRNLAYVDIIWVTQSQQHQGYGRRLLNEFENKLMVQNCKKVFLDAIDATRQGIFHKLGYSVMGILGDKDQQHVIMQKNLSRTTRLLNIKIPRLCLS